MGLMNITDNFNAKVQCAEYFRWKETGIWFGEITDPVIILDELTDEACRLIGNENAIVAKEY